MICSMEEQRRRGGSVAGRVADCGSMEVAVEVEVKGPCRMDGVYEKGASRGMFLAARRTDLVDCQSDVYKRVPPNNPTTRTFTSIQPSTSDSSSSLLCIIFPRHLRILSRSIPTFPSPVPSPGSHINIYQDRFAHALDLRDDALQVERFGEHDLEYLLHIDAGARAAEDE